VGRTIRAVLRGGAAVFSAVPFLWRRPRLWLLCAAPALTAAVVFSLATAAFFAYAFDPLTGWLTSSFAVDPPAAWYQWLWVGPAQALFWLVRALVLLSFLAVLYPLFLVSGGVLAAPFLDALSRRVEAIESVELSELGEGAGGILWSMGQELRRVAFLFAGTLTIAMLGWIPGAQLPALLAGALFTALFLPLEYTGFFLDRRAVTFRERRAWLWQHRAVMLGFGGLALATFLVPVLNFLCLPLLVTAGTRLGLSLDPPRSLEAREQVPL